MLVPGDGSLRPDVAGPRRVGTGDGGGRLNTLRYKGYTGVVELDEESGILSGTVADRNDVITFQGETVPELVQAFRDSVEDYLAFCTKLGREPALHRALAVRAASRGTSLNEVVAEALTAAVGSGTESLSSGPKT